MIKKVFKRLLINFKITISQHNRALQLRKRQLETSKILFKKLLIKQLANLL
jgi:hypothetical protein